MEVGIRVYLLKMKCTEGKDVRWRFAPAALIVFISLAIKVGKNHLLIMDSSCQKITC